MCQTLAGIRSLSQIGSSEEAHGLNNLEISMQKTMTMGKAETNTVKAKRREPLTQLGAIREDCTEEVSFLFGSRS